MPKSRTDYWTEKFDANVKRDSKAVEALARQGWRTAIIWECETKDEVRLGEKLFKLVRANEEC